MTEDLLRLQLESKRLATTDVGPNDKGPNRNYPDRNYVGTVEWSETGPWVECHQGQQSKNKYDNGVAQRGCEYNPFSVTIKLVCIHLQDSGVVLGAHQAHPLNCVDFLLITSIIPLLCRPSGAPRVSYSYPGLTPWATLCRA